MCIWSCGSGTALTYLTGTHLKVHESVRVWILGNVSFGFQKSFTGCPLNCHSELKQWIIQKQFHELLFVSLKEAIVFRFSLLCTVSLVCQPQRERGRHFLSLTEGTFTQLHRQNDSMLTLLSDSPLLMTRCILDFALCPATCSKPFSGQSDSCVA